MPDDGGVGVRAERGPSRREPTGPRPSHPRPHPRYASGSRREETKRKLLREIGKDAPDPEKRREPGWKVDGPVHSLYFFLGRDAGRIAEELLKLAVPDEQYDWADDLPRR